MKNLVALGLTPNTATEEQANTALIEAIKTDTPDGYAYLSGVASAFHDRSKDPLETVRAAIPCQGCAGKVLRATWLPNGALAVDIDPASKLAAQAGRLLGTDAARRVMESHFDLALGFGNCHKAIAGATRDQVTFTAADQIRWQESIDC